MFEVHIFLLNEGSSFLTLRFENDVNMYGTQTTSSALEEGYWFENDVNMYGTQTSSMLAYPESWFENDVNMYGTQTGHNLRPTISRLRMM